MGATTSSPGDEAQLAEAVRHAASARQAVEIFGGGSKRGWGSPLEADTTISTGKLAGITLYEPEALTVVVKAGTPLTDLQSALAEAGQHLPFEPGTYAKLLGNEDKATVGGTVACGVSGPRRIQAGACRDALLGVRFADGEGAIVKSGGRVMKNVTGYDLVKLLCGSHGTLGVISEVSFRVLPKPEAVGVLLLTGLTDDQAVAAMSAVLSSPFEVTGAAHTPKGLDGDPVTMIRLEGFEKSVRYRCGELKERLARFAPADIETRPERTAAGWAWVREVDTFAKREGAVWRVSVKPSDGPAVVAAVADEHQVEALYDWGGGLVWLLADASGDCGEAVIRRAVADVGGHATAMRVPDDAAVSARFHPEPPPVAGIVAGLRRQFDPHGIFNPGRMGA